MAWTLPGMAGSPRELGKMRTQDTLFLSFWVSSWLGTEAHTERLENRLTFRDWNGAEGLFSCESVGGPGQVMAHSRSHFLW